MPKRTSWEKVRRQIGVNEEMVAALARLDEAEELLARTVRSRGFAGNVDPDDEWTGDLHLFALARQVAAAGGRLELRAVFDDEEVVLLSEPPE